MNRISDFRSAANHAFSFLKPQPILFNLAFDYAKSTFAKTSCFSHLIFIKTCLKRKVIPKGFLLKHSPSDYSNVLLKQHTDFVLEKSSRNLMNVHIQHLDKKLKSICHSLSALKQQLPRILSPPLCFFVKTVVHCFNQQVFAKLKSTKDKKLLALCGQLPNPTPTNSDTSATCTHDNVRSKKVVCIPDSVQLSPSERSVLSKGLKFVPLTPSFSKHKALLELARFFRGLRWQAVIETWPRFQPADDIFTELFQRESHRMPPENCTDVEFFIAKTRREILKLPSKPLSQSNLSQSEWDALKSLKSRQDIVIKPADKGGAVVVWDRAAYIGEASRQLNDSSFYEPIPDSSLVRDNKSISNTIKSAIEKDSLPPTAQNLIVRKVKQPSFYLLPKIHKQNCPGRPIVSAVSCPTEHISCYLDFVFQPLVKSLPSYLKDTNHALNILDDFNHTPNFSPSLLFTMDVCSLYTSIPHQDGLKALKFFLDKRRVCDPPTPILLRLAELVLNMNSFEFNGNHFHQISGVAMGTKMGPSYACLFMGHLESNIFNDYTGPKPQLFKRYIDDCFGSTDISKSDLMNFIDFAKSYHQAIDFTYEISPTCVNFLDLEVTITNSTFQTSIYHKPTDSHSYVLYGSSHPKSTLNSIPYSQFLRLRRICSDDVDFESKANDMASFFVQRDYPNNIVLSALERVRQIPRSVTITPAISLDDENRPVVILTHHPHNFPIKRILKENWSILQDSPKVGSIFSNPPMFASKRDLNIRDYLVRSRLKPSISRLPGTYSCNKPSCITCAHLCHDTNITFPKKQFQIKRSFTCDSTNIVYAVLCKQCPKIYIGETERSLSTRFKEHLANIRHKRDLTVGPHFNEPDHSLDDALVLAIWQCHGSALDRKSLETYFINDLGTHQPLGLNRKM